MDPAGTVVHPNRRLVAFSRTPHNDIDLFDYPKVLIADFLEPTVEVIRLRDSRF